MVVLKRLADALLAGDPILAVVRGSALNQDGRSIGLTAPNGTAQRELLRAALADAGVAPAEVGYVETHGTGTALGDPIEAHALADVLKEGRGKDRRIRLGSVKTNLGHLEAAAGIAGFIKTVLCLQHGTIPTQLHFRELNPQIDFGGLPVEIPTKSADWEVESGRRIAGVSAFGSNGNQRPHHP